MKHDKSSPSEMTELTSESASEHALKLASERTLTQQASVQTPTIQPSNAGTPPVKLSSSIEKKTPRMRAPLISSDGKPPVLLLTSLAGAGKSTALQVFEDLHLFTADGVPPRLVPDLVALMHAAPDTDFSGVALGVDQRNTNLAEALPMVMGALKARGIHPVVVHLEASTTELMRRYATTRRPHPLERDGVTLTEALRRDMERMTPMRDMADLVLDTTKCSLHDLRRLIQRRWSVPDERLHAMKINLISFGFKYGVPREADMVFDLRFLPNPYFEANLKELTGKNAAVADFIFQNTTGQTFKKHLLDFIDFLLPLYESEGRYRLSVGLGCTGGKHRSVATTEALASHISQHDYSVTVEHRHMELG